MTINIDNTLSNYVPELDSISDDEMVLFNIGLTKRADDLIKIQNILQKNNLEFGNETNQWYIRREHSSNSDNGKIELFSPLMTAKQAKEIMPKLISDLDKEEVSKGLVVPIKAKELFENLSNKTDTPEIDQDELKKFIIGAYYYTKFARFRPTTEDFDYLKQYGIQSRDELPKTFYSLEKLEKQYPKDEFLFSGATASDDFLLLSGRPGRTGTVYATPDIEYATLYDGVTDVGKQEGTTATGNRYVSSIIGNLFDKDVKVGFINVYKQNPKDMFFSNFGMEDYRRFMNTTTQPKTVDMCEFNEEERKWEIAHKQAKNAPNKRLTRDQALNGYVGSNHFINIDGKDYMPVSSLSFNSETFVTPEKNPLYEKILHIEWDGRNMFIPVNENKEHKIINAILNERKADATHTFNDGHEDIFDRLQKQKHEYKKMVFEKAIKKIPQKDDSYKIDLNYDR